MFHKTKTACVCPYVLWHKQTLTKGPQGTMLTILMVTVLNQNCVSKFLSVPWAEHPVHVFSKMYTQIWFIKHKKNKTCWFCFTFSRAWGRTDHFSELWDTSCSPDESILVSTTTILYFVKQNLLIPLWLHTSVASSLKKKLK